MMSWLQDPAAMVAHWPLLAMPFVVALAMFLKYVVPPFPGDSVMLLGFFLSSHGGSPPWIMVAAVCLGGLLGAACAFYLGRRLGAPLLDLLERRSSQKVPVDKLRHVFRTFGEKSLLLNRFLPILRSFMLYAAGASGLRTGPAIFWSFWSNFLFALLLAAIGHNVSSSWPEIVAIFQNVGRGAGLVAVVLLAVLLGAGLLWRRRAARQAAEVEALALDK
jgi:membrane protein DedA with SNARE-associated domain